jgi:tRNA-specific 2-thiouridylase
MRVRDLNWIGFDPPATGGFRCAVQVRYHHRAAPCEVQLGSEGEAEVSFDEPQLAVAPGQGAAFYDGDRLLGGGWIARAPSAARLVGAEQPAAER